MGEATISTSRDILRSDAFAGRCRVWGDEVSATQLGLFGSSYQGMTLSEARENLNANLEDGTECVCCGQYARTYRRKLNSNMVVFLVDLVKKTGTDEWIHYGELEFTGRDYNYLKHFGLAECKVNKDPGKKGSGMWRPTERGVDFVHGRTKVPTHVFLYNNRIKSWSDTKGDVKDALGSKFNYSELLRGESSVEKLSIAESL